MGASFPNGVVEFQAKRDQLDINYAADINRIQDEITAIEQVLAPLVTSYTQLATDQAGNQAQDVTNFNNIKEEFAYAFTGSWVPAIQITAGTQWIQQDTDSDFDSAPTSVTAWSKPNTASDPETMFNGHGFTTKQAGFWLIYGYTRFLPTSKSVLIPSQQGWFSSPTQNIGYYEAQILINGNAHTVARAHSVTGTDSVPINVNAVVWLPAGTKVDLGVHHNAQIKQRTGLSRISAVCLRQSGTKWTDVLTPTLAALQQG